MLKKRIVFCILCALFTFSSLAECEDDFRRGLFVSVIQDPPVLSSRRDIGKLIVFARSARIKTLSVQIYYANKAWFPSKIADSSPYQECLKNLSEDPLALLIKEAHANGIEVYAWMNMLSLGANKDAVFLKKYGPDILTRNLKKKRALRDYKIDNQFFLEPGDLRVREELLGVLGEVLSAYPGLDGVLFDYIRYPDKDPVYGYTPMNIERFKKATGNKTIDESSKVWKDWKRDQVTEVLRLLVDRARKARPSIKISATGCMPYSRAYLEAFQNWPSWIDRGLVDYVTVMNYSPHPDEFEQWIVKAKLKTADFKKVNIGLGAYKLVLWPDTFKQEFRICQKSGAGGFVVFHYGSLLENPALSDFLIKDRK
ncbi:MAG: family 10 glycosylhydrolase [Candidatus Omnitrophica bacterium]|nr:family 10 glycosylhydrolase [Candidatus Omnitrophota bacterium]